MYSLVLNIWLLKEVNWVPLYSFCKSSSRTCGDRIVAKQLVSLLYDSFSPISVKDSFKKKTTKNGSTLPTYKNVLGHPGSIGIVHFIG